MKYISNALLVRCKRNRCSLFEFVRFQRIFQGHLDTWVDLQRKDEHTKFIPRLWSIMGHHLRILPANIQLLL